MTIRDKDIDLVCPNDGTRLRHVSLGFECIRGHRWEVVNAIPRFVDGSHYTEAFGAQWNTWPEVQLDSFTGFPISAARVKLCLGDAIMARIASGAALNILEAGCGAGRFTEILLNYPSVHVHSIDASIAVEANQKNNPQSERHRVYQADISRLPFAPRQFDLVFCLGVVQHTPNPEATIRRLYEQVREGGALVFDHYVSYLRGLTNPGRVVLRFFIKRMAAEKGILLTNRLVDTLFPLHRATKDSRFLRFVLSKVSPLSTAFHHPELDDRLQHQWSRLNTHDGLTDWYQHSRTKSQIQRVLQALGAEGVEVFKGSNGVVGRCIRPF